eukprot:599164-Rhodomonas_salina.1
MRRRLCGDDLQRGGCRQDHPIVARVSVWFAGVARPVGRAAGLGGWAGPPEHRAVHRGLRRWRGGASGIRAHARREPRGAARCLADQGPPWNAGQAPDDADCQVVHGPGRCDRVSPRQGASDGAPRPQARQPPPHRRPLDAQAHRLWPHAPRHRRCQRPACARELTSQQLAGVVRERACL